MLYGRVVGTVWATRKDPLIEGLPLLAIERVHLDGATVARGAAGETLVAVDTVSAGVGEIVLVSQGSSARQTEKTRDRPVDATIVAIPMPVRQRDERCSSFTAIASSRAYSRESTFSATVRFIRRWRAR